MHKILNYAILLVVFITFINALIFFGLGIFYSFKAYNDIVLGRMENLPGVVLVESLDRFLVGFVYVIFSIGLSKLFLADVQFLDKYELPWLKLTEFSQLKTLLISALLVALFVAWVPYAITAAENEHNDWTIVLFPVCLLIMAISGKFIKDLH